jgi:hypothetical protein
MKFQIVVTPDGLIAHIFGPIEGRHHDVYVLAESNLLQLLAEHSQFDGYVLFGDQGYHTSAYMASPWKGAFLTPEQLQFNNAMSPVRVAVEWQFGRIIQYWHYLDLRSAMKVFETPVARLYMAGVLLSNCDTCIQGGNQTSRFLDLSPPMLHEYLHANED